MGEQLKIIVKWGASEYEITELNKEDSVCDLKRIIQSRTRVLPKRQKLLNLKLKGKPSTDDAKLSEFNLKPGFKLLMMGSLEEDIEQTSAPPSDMPVVVNDFDIEEEVNVPIEEKEEYLKKVQKRISEYTPTVLNEPRSDKSLLVLDIDYTLFDHRSAAEQGIELMRPYLHQFLASAYEDYDIIIWSATSMKWICEKMKLLGVSNHSDYKIMAYFDSAAMITVHAPKYGVIEVKPLGVIWGLYTQFGTWNTIMFDDLRRNFLMNPKNGLKVKPFRDAHINRYHDDELLKLSKYLKHISKLGNFAELNHRSWEKYLEKKEKLAKERH